MTFSKKQAAQMLGVSARTLDRHISAGRLTVERGERKNFEQSVTVSLEALGQYLGITDPAELRQRLGLPCVAELATDAPEPCVSKLDTHPSGPSTEHPEPTVPSAVRPELPPLAQRVADDLDFAERYLRGEVSDSAGNYYDGHNARWSERVSLLGPGVEPAPQPECNAHINPALRSDTGWNGISADSPEHPLNAGFKGMEVKRPRHPNRTRQVGLNRALQVRFI
jgi:hypothetical protein